MSRGVALHVFVFLSLVACALAAPAEKATASIGEQTAASQCPMARNVYIDAGVNWCNTFEIFKKVPEARARPPLPWHVFGFEPSPRIAPFAEQCASALTAGRSTPIPPIPPTGSSNDLRRYAPAYNCSTGRRSELLPCMLSKLGPALSLLRPDPAFSSRTLTSSRLSLGARCNVTRDTYVFVPVATAASPGELTFFEGDAGLLIGGTSPHGYAVRKHTVEQIDLSAWMKASFSKDDFLVLKMDIEGAEHEVLPKMIRDGTLSLVDVLLWECHTKHAHRCWKLTQHLVEHGVRVYREPYPW